MLGPKVDNRQDTCSFEGGVIRVGSSVLHCIWGYGPLTKSRLLQAMGQARYVEVVTAYYQLTDR